MSAKKTFLMTFVFLCACALVAGCGSDTVSPPVDEAPILPPQNLSAGSSAVNKLVLTWDPNTQNKLAGYNVYRVDIVAEDVVKLTPALITDSMFKDYSARRGVEYEYRVTSVSTNDKESAYVSLDVLLMAVQDENEPKFKM
jgi:fibronectin type 3 domain-containing protein